MRARQLVTESVRTWSRRRIFGVRRPDRSSDAGVVFSEYQTINERSGFVVRVRRPALCAK